MTDDTRGRRERADTDARRIIKFMWDDYTIMADKTHGASSHWAFVQVRELQRVLTTALAEAERRAWEEAALCIINRHKGTDSDKWLSLASELKTRDADGVIPQAQAGEEG